MISFSIINTTNLNTSKCFYKQDEYALYSLGINYEIPQKENLLRDNIDQYFGLNKKEFILVFAGDLVLTFEKETGYFVSLDACTFMKSWLQSEISVPAIHGQGILQITHENELDINYIRYTERSLFKFDSKKKILQICFTDSEPEAYFKISDNIICGMSSNSLSCFILHNIQLI